jgi:hypothetical protein
MPGETLTLQPLPTPELPPGSDPNLDSVIHDSVIAQEQLPPVEAELESRWRHHGKNVLSVMSKDILLDVGINTALSAVGIGGVGGELLSTSSDTAISRKLENRKSSGEIDYESPSRLKRVGKKVGSFALGATTAYVAQKFGTEMVDHIQSSLNEGLGSFAVPVASKFGAAALINSVVRR